MVGRVKHLGIGSVVLLPFDVRLYIGGRQQPNVVAKALERACPVVCCRASLDADQRGRQVAEAAQQPHPLQLAANDNVAASINNMDLEHGLRDVQANSSNRSHTPAPLAQPERRRLSHRRGLWEPPIPSLI
jgi:hypothetical protein